MKTLGLSALRVIEGDVDIIDSGLESFAGLERLNTLTGRLYVNGALELESLDGLENLTAVGEILVWSCPKLVDLRALSSLESVTNGCSFLDNETLPTCEAQWLRGIVEGLGGSFSSTGTNDQGVCQ
jgi:hypothetical protein